jgi:hypothetical protein
MKSPVETWREGGFTGRALLLLQTLLASISFVATTWGFADLMGANVLTARSTEQYIEVVLVVAIASAVMMSMLVGLFAFLDRDRSFLGRLIGGLVYLFFVFWSIAFGYGFFWKTFASEEFTRDNFKAQSALVDARVQKVTTVLGEVALIAKGVSETASEQSDKEATYGRSCENNRDSPPNKPGSKSPLTDARRTTAEDAANAFQSIEFGWKQPVDVDASRLRWQLLALDPQSQIQPDKSGARLDRPSSESDIARFNEIRSLIGQETPEGRTAAYKLVQSDINAFVNRANDLQATIGEDAKATFERLDDFMRNDQGRPRQAFCQDIPLANQMKDAASSLAALKPIEAIRFESKEGAEATKFASLNLAKHAIFQLTNWTGQPLGGPDNDEEWLPLTEDDIVALYATAAIDFALLVVSILARPPDPSGSPVSRFLRRSVLRRNEPAPSEIIEDSKRAELTGAALERKNKVDLDLRRKRRQHKSAIIDEERAEIEIDQEQLDIDTRRREIETKQAEQSSARSFNSQVSAASSTLMADVVQLVGGNRVLASELLFRASEAIEQIDGQFYLAMVRTVDPEDARRMKRFENYLQLHDQYGIMRVDPVDSVFAEIQERLRLEDEADGRHRELSGLFRIQRRFGQTLLAVPAPSQVEAEVQSEEFQTRATPPPSQDAPTFGDINPEDYTFGRAPGSKKDSSNGADDSWNDPSNFRKGKSAFTRNDPSEDKGAESNRADRSANGTTAYADDHRAKPEKNGFRFSNPFASKPAKQGQQKAGKDKDNRSKNK